MLCLERSWKSWFYLYHCCLTTFNVRVTKDHTPMIWNLVFQRFPTHAWCSLLSLLKDNDFLQFKLQRDENNCGVVVWTSLLVLISKILLKAFKMEALFRIPFKILVVPNLKLKRPSWFHQPSAMFVFACVMFSYFMVTAGKLGSFFKISVVFFMAEYDYP